MKTDVLVVFAIPVRNENSITALMTEIDQACAHAGVIAKFVLAVNNSTPEFVDRMDELSRERADLVTVLQLGTMEGYPFSYAYLRTLQVAHTKGDIVVEIDAGGSFPVKYAMEMVQKLRENSEIDAVFSNRFFHSGRIWNMFHHRPSRIFTSMLGTLLANIFLPLGKIVPDMTSGLSVMRSSTVEKVFTTYPEITNFVSVKIGPGHFFQTEWRYKVLTVTKRVVMHNIRMGEFKERMPAKLGNSTLLTALKALFVLRKDHNQR